VILERLEATLEPGLTEIEVQRMVQQWARAEGLSFAWDEAENPIVDFGPRHGKIGHTLPGETALEPGHVVHVDLGFIKDGFASDLQRTWYWLAPGEAEPPEAVRRTFAASLSAMDAGFAALRPGARGFEVDTASRGAVQQAGFAEPGFAFGHPVGQVAHDGGTTLGPRWERYGQTPFGKIQQDNVFAIEMDLEVPDVGGLVGIEEEVVVTENGAEYLSKPQRELRLLSR
jgi:Xaa-Pro aminopeptidase